MADGQPVELDDVSKAELLGVEPPKEEPKAAFPEVPEGELSVAQAYDVLGIPPQERGNVEKIKTAYRKMSMKYHPDKNPRQQEAATKVFTAVTAAYHTLTTNNFDYKRWAASYNIPPMQSLEQVLQMALQGLDTFELEAMLRKRGDYRPHEKFGVDLNVPWTAGTKEDPSYDIPVGSAYRTTRELEYGASGARMEIGWGGLERDHVAGHSADRPWERVGGTGWEDVASVKRIEYTPPEGLRPDLGPGSGEAPAAAEACNDRGMAHFKAKEWREAYECYGEAVRLQPAKAPYRGNRAAAGLKLERWREVIEDCEAAVRLDEGYVRGYVRLAQAGIGLDNKEGYQKAVAALEAALELEPDNKTAKKLMKEAAIGLEAEDSD